MRSLREWGWKGAESAGVARAVSAHGDYFHLVCDEAEGEILARKKTSAFRGEDVLQPVTGDFVRFEYNPQGESRVLEVLPRMSFLARLDPSSSGRREQILAVNFDTLFFAMSLNENFSVPRLDRFLTLAESSGCLDRVQVLLTKCDLDSACAVDEEDVPDRVRTALGTALRVSAKTGEGLDAVRALVTPGRTVALIGSSGVGKSSLVNTLAGEEWMATGEIQEWNGKGRHTTTSRELVMLPDGAMVLDTPGLREFGLLGTDGIRERSRSVSSHRFRK